MSRIAILIAAILVCAAERAQARAPDPGTEKQREAGKALYMKKCSQCHGEAGDGKDVGTEFFRPLPRDFTSGAFKVRTTGSGELPTDTDLKSIIKRGMPHTGMPAWPQFSDEELANLAYYIKTFNADFADSVNLTAPLEFGKAPAFSQESANRGRKVYEENKCLDCHGAKGRGDGESGPTLKDDMGQFMRPADLTKRWTFRGGPTREDIYRTFMTGLNGTPMPSYASAIEKMEDRWALVDYVYSLYPSDKAPYASVVVAERIPGTLDPAKGRDLFKDAAPALFPVVGQVIEGKRNFFPAVDAVEVRAVYDSTRIAIMVSWHDMSPDRQGSNSPLTKAQGLAPVAGAAAAGSVADSAASKPAEGVADANANAAGTVSDAVSIQLPLNNPEGVAKPYFLFGDSRNPAEVWFQDLAKGAGERFIGKGDGNLAPDGAFETKSGYADGEWWVTLVRPRNDGKRLTLDPGAFVPIAFSVWDGFGGETGSARGITSWYNLFLKPAGEGSPLVPASKSAAGILLAELAAIWLIRRRMRATRK